MVDCRAEASTDLRGGAGVFKVCFPRPHPAINSLLPPSQPVKLNRTQLRTAAMQTGSALQLQGGQLEPSVDPGK